MKTSFDDSHRKKDIQVCKTERGNFGYYSKKILKFRTWKDLDLFTVGCR